MFNDMQTNQINDEMQSYECFKGTFAADMLPIVRFNHRPIAFILNTDTSDKPGEHWVALFIDENNEAEYFDSFGFTPIIPKIFDFLQINKIKVLRYNKYQLQSVFTSTCGMYCILYIKMRCSGKSFPEFINLFTKNKLINDLIASHIIN